MTGILIIIAILAFGIFLLTYKTKSEKEQDKKLMESLNDEHLIDPVTGTKITLEQAESGQWEPEVRSHFYSEEEIQNSVEEEIKQMMRGNNYLYNQKQYLIHQLTETQINFFEQTEMFRKYDSWTYSDAFKIDYCEGYIVLPNVNIKSKPYSRYEYQDTQCLFWLKLKNQCGHYYISEKSNKVKLYELVTQSEELRLKNYEILVIEPASNMPVLHSIISVFEDTDALEIEIFKQYLLIKNLKYLNVDQIKVMETLLTKLHKYLAIE